MCVWCSQLCNTWSNAFIFFLLPLVLKDKKIRFLSWDDWRIADRLTVLDVFNYSNLSSCVPIWGMCASRWGVYVCVWWVRELCSCYLLCCSLLLLPVCCWFCAAEHLPLSWLFLFGRTDVHSSVSITAGLSSCWVERPVRPKKTEKKLSRFQTT